MKTKGTWLLIAIFILIFLILILFILWQKSLEGEVKKYSDLIHKYNKTDSLIIYITPEIQQYISQKNDKYLVINRDDLEYLSGKLGVEISKLQNNASNYISQIQADIDRLNLFTTTAVFFLGLIGFIFPLMGYFSTKSDIKEYVDSFNEKMNQDKAELNDKNKEYERKLEETSNKVADYQETINKNKNDVEKLSKDQNLFSGKFDTFKDEFGKIKSQSEQVEEKVNFIDKKIDSAEKKLPEINLLTFQNAINRLLNVNQARLLNLIRNGRQKYLLDFLKTIVLSIENCCNDNLNENQQTYLRKILFDFEVGLSNSAFQTILTKKELQVFEKFINEVKDINKHPDFNNTYSQSMKSLKIRMDEMIKELDEGEKEHD